MSDLITRIQNFWHFYFGEPVGWLFYGGMFFVGYCFGWFFKKGRLFWIVIALMIFGGFLEFMIKINHWTFTLPFMLGFLTQIAKPIYEKLQNLKESIIG